MYKQRIRDLREDSDLYQKDIADKLKVTQQSYSLWEIGVEIIPLKHLNTLCNFYDVSMDYVLYLSNEKKPYNINNVVELDKNVIKQKLKEVRHDNNLTFRELADELNTTASTLHAYESGKTLILTSFLYQICEKYNISMDWFCGRSDKKYLSKVHS